MKPIPTIDYLVDLKASGADVLCDFSTPKFAAMAMCIWSIQAHW